MSERPASIHPDLIDRNLSAIGAALAEARNGAQDHALEHLGDDNWTIGCVGFRRSCQALIDLAAHEPWLHIIDAGMEFHFSVGSVPIRFYHGDAKNPPPRYRQSTSREECYLQGVLSFANDAAKAVFRLAVETDNVGHVEQVQLVQVLEGADTKVWPIWSRGDSDGVRVRTADGMELGPPSVTYDDADTATGTDGVQ